MEKAMAPPLQYSCLENPMDGGAWQATVYGGLEELDTTECLHLHFSLSCIGEGNGNPPQCSYLENLRDRGAWWAAVYGVTQSWIRLKQLSSSINCILVDVKWYLNVVCISLTITLNIIHVFIDHLYIFLEKHLFKFFIVF